MAVRLPPDPEGQDTFGEIRNGNGYATCIKYAWEGKESCRTIAQALAAWTTAEEAHAAALRKMANSFDLPEFSETASTLNTSWQALRLGMLHHSRNAEQFAKVLRGHETGYVEFRHAQSKLKRKLEAEKKATTNALNASMSATNKLKKKYTSACKTAESAIAKRNAAGDDPKTKPDYFKKLNSKVEKCMKDVEKCDANYQGQVDALNVEEVAHREKMDHILKELQAIEEDRVVHTKTMLQDTSVKALAVFQSTMEGWDGVTQGVGAINVHTDMKRFVMRSISDARSKGPDAPYLAQTNYEAYSSSALDAEGRTSTRKDAPKPAIFKRPGSGGPGACGNDSGKPGRGGSSSSSGSRGSGSGSGSHGGGESKATPDHGAALPPHPMKSGSMNSDAGGIVRPPTTPHVSLDGKQLKNAKAAVSGATAPETAPPETASPAAPPTAPQTAPAPPLRSTPPALAAMPPKSAPSKPPGMDTPRNSESASASGLAAAVTRPAPAPPTRGGADKNPKPKWARATFDFEGEDAKDLSFIEGDMIELSDIEDKDWWKGRLNGRGDEGAFPSNYAELIFGTGVMKAGIAKYDFHSDEPGEISFKQGDAIDIIWIDEQSSGWWEGQSVSGAVGLFPSNRVEVKD
jgi:hypothetical protein